MKVLILADLEGVSGVGDWRHLIPAGPVYREACENLTQDINAAFRGLKAAGATKVDVVDSHSTVWPTRKGPRNVVKDRVDPGIHEVIGGWDMLELTRSDPDALRAYDAQVIVGEHAMAGTPDGFVSHTHSEHTALRMNGRYVGEIEWQTWLLGYYDVPTIMVTGDAAAIREVKSFFSEVEGVAVKTAKARDKAECLPLDEARRLMEETASKAPEGLKKIKPQKLRPPIKIDLVFTAPETARFGSYMPGVQRTDDRTVSFTARDYSEAVWAHMSLVMLSALQMFSEDFEKLFGLLPEDGQKKFNDDYVEKISQWATGPSPFSPPELTGANQESV